MQTDPETMEEAYKVAEDDPETDYMRVIYEFPGGEWRDVKGYVLGDYDSVLMVVNEDKITKIPAERVVREESV